MLLVWNSIFLAKVDQHVDHLINFVDQLLINMLISWSTLLFNSWSTCCFHVTCFSTVDQHVVFQTFKSWSTVDQLDETCRTTTSLCTLKLINCWLTWYFCPKIVNMLSNSWSTCWFYPRVTCWSTLDHLWNQMLINSGSKVEQLLIKCWSTFDQKLINC